METAMILGRGTDKEKVKEIKKAIKEGKYNWDLAIKHTADRIIEYPESLLWR